MNDDAPNPERVCLSSTPQPHSFASKLISDGRGRGRWKIVHLESRREAETAETSESTAWCRVQPPPLPSPPPPPLPSPPLSLLPGYLLKRPQKRRGFLGRVADVARERASQPVSRQVSDAVRDRGLGLGPIAFLCLEARKSPVPLRPSLRSPSVLAPRGFGFSLAPPSLPPQSETSISAPPTFLTRTVYRKKPRALCQN